jgi:hypothetical protein
VGTAGTRFHLSEPGPRALVLFLAALADGLVFSGIASAFDVGVTRLSPLQMLVRAGVNATAGMLLFELVDRQRGRLRRA